MLLVVLGYTKAATPLPSTRANAGLSMDASPDMCFLLGISLQARYVKIARRLGLTQAAGFVVVFRYLCAQATSTPSEVFDVAVSKRKC